MKIIHNIIFNHGYGKDGKKHFTHPTQTETISWQHNIGTKNTLN